MNSKKYVNPFTALQNRIPQDLIEVVKKNPGISLDGISHMTTYARQTCKKHLNRMIKSGLVFREKVGIQWSFTVPGSNGNNGGNAKDE